MKHSVIRLFEFAKDLTHRHLLIMDPTRCCCRKSVRDHSKIILLTALLCISFTTLRAQFYNGSQMTFGKSRVQFNDFFWTYYKFEKFDTYFYLNGKELAQFAAEYAAREIRKIELELQSGLEDKVQFIIFNNLSDLKQSNIGLYGDWDTYNTGGVTRILGGRVLIYFDGNYKHFEQQIKAGIATVILNQMMYGTGIGAQIKNNALFSMPDWYMNGLISYISVKWDTEVDNLVRAAVLSGKYEKFNRLTGMEATWAGHSLWHYIAMKYGESAIPNIVYMSRLSRNIEKGFMEGLGVPYKTLLKDWLSYYKEQYTAQETGRDEPTGDQVVKKPKASRTYRQLKMSPDYQLTAFSIYDLGVYKVFLKNLESGKTRRIFRGGYRIAEKTDYTYPLLAWHPTGKILAILIERKGEINLCFYNLTEKRKSSMVLYDFQKILDMAYSDDGSLLVFSAVQKGQSDIFVFNIASGSYEQITNDIFNDFNPRFIDHSKSIIFASNRISDTIRFYKPVRINELHFTNDIFIYNYRSKSPLLTRITDTPETDEIQPMAYADGYLCYLSDQNGIYNRFLAKFDSTISFVDTTTHYRYFTTAFPVTNYRQSILEQDISLRCGTIGEVVFGKPTESMYRLDLIRPALLSGETLNPTSYRMRQDQLFMKQATIQQKDTAEAGQHQEGKPGKHHFTTVHLKEVIEEMQSDPQADSLYLLKIQKMHQIQYPAKKESDKLLATLLTVAKDSVNKYKQAKALNYNVEYAIDEMVTQLDFTNLNFGYQPFVYGNNPFPNPGINALFMVGITDLMEDYRITGGVRLNFDLVNNEYLFSYKNMKRRLDHEIIYHRSGLDAYSQYFLQRLKTNELFYVLTYPFTPVLNIKGTATVRYDRIIFLSTDLMNLQMPDIHDFWGSVKAELTYDNTRSLGVNLYQGTRYKVFGEYYHHLDQSGQNMFVVGFDFRNYQRVHRTLIWANRIAYSSSFGNSKLVYYLGGVDNWLFPRFNAEIPVAMDQNYAFQTLATNMRGFSQNIRNGNSFFVLNSELRMPVFRYFFNRPIRSDFINNFQIVAFGDYGTAWTGASPFSEDNQLFTRYIYNNPLFIQVEMLKNPMVGGFGAGARTKLLGYFVRGDVAWGIEEGSIRKPIFYLSLSLDF